MLLTTAEKMREADHKAIFSCGIDSLLLMERAASHITNAVKNICKCPGNVLCVCGTGNNGGDGFACASQLLLSGYDVTVVLVGDENRLSSDCLTMKNRYVENGGFLEYFNGNTDRLRLLFHQANVIVDALFGIGLNREITGVAAEAIELINQAEAYVISADIPSGVSADDGQILGVSVKANETLTFSLAKPGLYSDPGSSRSGNVHICPIGIPKNILSDAVSPSIKAYTVEDASIPERKQISHKGDYGKVFILGGCIGYTGAPSIAAKAALRAGAGLVTIGVPSEIYPITATKNEEAMPFPLPSVNGKLCHESFSEASNKINDSDVVVAGPGLGRSESTENFIFDLLNCHTQLVLDADALFPLKKKIELLKECKYPPVLTPHEGEFLRLGGILSGNRIHDALTFSRKNNCILVLKGHRTITAFPDDTCYINTTGGPGLSKGGSGDALSGIIGALLCILPPKEAVPLAVFIHSLAGDIATDQYTEHCVLASDIISALPKAYKYIINKNNL